MSAHIAAPVQQAVPGDVVAEALQVRGMSQAECARRTGLSTKHVNQIVGGYAAITPETALKLERVTRVSAQFWVGLEVDYQLQRARQVEAAELETQSSWLRAFPVVELVKRGVMHRSRDTVEQVRELLAFFGIAEPSAWKTIWDLPTAYRKSRAFESDLPALAAWLRIGELRAEAIDCRPFDRSELRAALAEARGLTRVADPRAWVPQLTQLCSQAGVAVVIEREIAGARINGAVRWIRPEHALIQLSLRHRWADVFWFTFFHEAGHLLLHDRRKTTFIDIGGGTNRAELQADEFASRTLIPREAAARLTLLRTAADIETFADQTGVGAGVVVGRLQHDRVLRQSELNELRVRFTFDETGELAVAKRAVAVAPVAHALGRE